MYGNKSIIKPFSEELMFYSSIDWHKENVSSFWTATLFLVSILPIIGYIFHVGLLFSISGIVCTIDVIANIVATLYVIEAHRRISFLFFFSAVFFPVLLIGCLIAREVFAGIALGMGFTGIVIAIIAWIKRYVDSKVLFDTDKWLEKEFGDEDRVSEKDALIPILLDENAVYELDRVKAMHTAYARISRIYASIEKEVNILNENKDTIHALMKYEASGLRKNDFEADNSGEIYVQDKYLDVLEDGNLTRLAKQARYLHEQFGEIDSYFF